MNRLFFAFIAATLLVVHPIRAMADEEGVGRFQLIPGVTVPGKSAKARERTVLLDSITGRTWVLVPGAVHGDEPGPLWMPIKVKSETKDQELAKSPLDANERDNQQASDTGRRHRNRLKRDFDDYDDDP